MRKLLLGLVACLSVVGTAFANMYNMDCCPTTCIPCCNFFDGFYVGGNVGAIGHTSYRNDLDGFFNVVDLSIDPAGTSFPAGFTSQTVNVTAGVQVGYDWQCCHKVLGVVADWNWARTKEHTHFNSHIPGITESIKSRLHWFTTIRGRAGLALDDVLVYVTAGGAVAKFNDCINNSILGVTNFKNDKTRWGLTAGVGTEWVVWDNWSLDLEFLYLIFPAHRRNITVLGTEYQFRNADTAFVGRVGLNYRFCL